MQNAKEKQFYTHKLASLGDHYLLFLSWIRKSYYFYSRTTMSHTNKPSTAYIYLLVLCLMLRNLTAVQDAT